MKLTPEEEAIDLIDSFYTNELDQYKAFGKNNYKFAVQSALLCVNKILNEYPSQCPKERYEMERHIFWKEVKQELLKIK